MNFDKFFIIAKEKGLEATQVYLEHSVQLDLEVFKGELEKNQIADSRVLTIQGIYQGKMGKLTTEVLDEGQEEAWADDLIKSASLIESKDEVFIYEGSAHYETVEGLRNEAIEAVDIKTKIDMVFALDAKMRDLDERADLTQAFYGQSRKRVLLQNSKGLKLEKDVNSAVLGGYVVARQDGDSRTAFDYVQSNDMADFDLDVIAETTVTKAVSQLGAKPVPSGTYEILLQNTASASLLAAHVSMFSAESVQKGMSKLAGKVGQSIAAESIRIIDDPFRKKSPKSGAFDDEGVSTQPLELISGGVLKGYMHNLKTARKADATSTGHGYRGGVSPTNFHIQAGTADFDATLQSIEKGLLITDLQGTHAGTNAISGDFSLQASGFLIEQGKMTQPVALITVAGNYLDLLNDVTTLCDDLKFGFGFIGSPSLKIKSLVVSGS
ncbi:MAG: TldD/PmbA family protein [Acholeplasmatales bacterium]|nr:MAG: TldD/PmbA family protein [Acholeplasmatales bacterium]